MTPKILTYALGHCYIRPFILVPSLFTMSHYGLSVSRFRYCSLFFVAVQVDLCYPSVSHKTFNMYRYRRGLDSIASLLLNTSTAA
jgi:hypothetical protein